METHFSNKLLNKPLTVLYDSIRDIDPIDFERELKEWKQTALSNEQAEEFNDGDLRLDAFKLFDNVKTLVRAIEKAIQAQDYQGEDGAIITECRPPIVVFFQSHRIEYVRSLLWELLYSAILKEGSIYDNNLCRANLLFLYKNTLGIVESAHILLAVN